MVGEIDMDIDIYGFISSSSMFGDYKKLLC